MGKQTQSSFKCHMYQIDNKRFPALVIFSYSAASMAALLLVVFLVKCQVPWQTPIRKLKSPTRNIVLYFDFWGLSLLKCRHTIFLLCSLWISSSLCLSKHLTRHTHTHTHFTLSFARVAFLSAPVVFTPTGRHEFTGCRRVRVSRWGSKRRRYSVWPHLLLAFAICFSKVQVLNIPV